MPKRPTDERPEIRAAEIGARSTRHGAWLALAGVLVTAAVTLFVGIGSGGGQPDPLPGPQPVPGPAPTPQPEKPKRSIVDVRTASYGYAPDEFCDKALLARELREKCKDVTNCRIFVSNDICGDPAKYKRKEMRIAWNCVRDGEAEGQDDAVGHDGELLTLQCKQ
jgi:hypothetical protein